ncbi:hypothetical protein SKAU_G00176060 [Synaphobranchus kaupii]|uniref:tRNA-splicing endonuclease subunit Sen2 n=1 Tax=Synaphobranchus kaupii TaxID=118154 RepID=A0A9Q1J0A3_SYNKA|nr:hypothetical protein SKAU_G00176060 [Synaphobranchus kaupii]
MAEAVFQAPKRRVRVYESYEAPFPVPASAEDAIFQEHRVYRAEILNQHVIVRDPDHIQALYGKGYFGKGILSRSRPEHSISDKWRNINDRCLPVVSFTQYQQRVNLARDVLLTQGLDEEAANQVLEKYTHPIKLDLTGGTGEEEAPKGALGEGPGRSPNRGSPNRGSPGPSGVDLSGGKGTESADPECAGAERLRRQGDARYDPLAHVYPCEPEAVDPEALRDLKCARHDDWIAHCGCSLNNCILRTDIPANRNEQSPNRTSGYEYVLVEEQEQQEGVDAVGNSSRSINQTEGLVCRANPFTIVEYLQLSLEEAFFLVYALGCLSVYYNEEPLTIIHLWEVFRSVQPNFETSYMAYHYFRCKGWVPKVGMKYGTDLILYRKGPPFYHASYSVVVEKVDDSFRGAALRPFSWRSLAALNRITGNVSKELMLCYIIRPSDMTEEELSSPECIKRIKVQEIVVSRWISSRERTDQEEEL